MRFRDACGDPLEGGDPLLAWLPFKLVCHQAASNLTLHRIITTIFEYESQFSVTTVLALLLHQNAVSYGTKVKCSL
jgi:hypothetical protein